MFQVNDMVTYGVSGVCKIVDIRKEKFGVEEKLYYILTPAEDKNSIIYCPVDADKIKIKKLLTRDEIYKLIEIMPNTQTVWIENDQKRRERFGEILKRGSHQEMVMLIKTLHAKQAEKRQNGKKFHVNDEKIMKEAEKILHGEFAHVLHIQREEVVPFITGELQKKI